MIFVRNMLLVLGVAAFSTGFALAEKQRPLKSSPYDPDARAVELFSGQQAGEILAQVTPNGAAGGNLFLTNQTQEPLTVKMPAGFVGIPVNPQFIGLGQGNSPFGSNFGNQGPGMGLSSGMNSSMAANGTQAFGGGTGNQMSGMNGMNGMNMNGMNSGNSFPNGFFSIPAGKTLRVPYTSVCLNHGLNEPTSRTTVKLVPVEEYTEDPVLQTLISQVGTHPQQQHTLQAAIWHVANGMSWEQLARKSVGPVSVPGRTYFSQGQMTAARSIVKEIQSTLPAAEKTTIERPAAVAQQATRSIRSFNTSR